MTGADDGRWIEDWLSAPRDQVNRAREDTGGPNPSPGKVIAQLSFGFWRHLTERAQHDSLWRPYLRTAFTPGTDRRRVDRSMDGVLRLRNRIAHHEPLLRTDIPARFGDLLTVAGLLSEPLRDYITAHSLTPELVRQRPAV